MAMPPPDPPPSPNTNKDKEYNYTDTQKQNITHKENSITQHYEAKQSKKKKATVEGWKQGFLLN
eukprot:530659-Ditylum_brightwellii.AAC.1